MIYLIQMKEIKMLNNFEIILTIVCVVYLLLNTVLAYYWQKAEHEVHSIKIGFIRDLFWIRNNGQSIRS